MSLKELATDMGWHFFAKRTVEIGNSGKCYDLDSLSIEQWRWVAARLQRECLNGAFLGTAKFQLTEETEWAAFPELPQPDLRDDFIKKG